MEITEIASTSSVSFPPPQADPEIPAPQEKSSRGGRLNNLFKCCGCLRPRTRDDRLSASRHSHPSKASSRLSEASTNPRSFWIVSNRVNVPGPEAPVAAGGLDLALMYSLKKKDSAIRVGSRDAPEHADGSQPPIQCHTQDNITYATFPLTKDEKKGYYDRFSNGALWPIFHELDGKLAFNGYQPISQYTDQDYRTYKAVNKRFVEVLSDASLGLESDHIIWAHDYHLIPFAKACRKAEKENTIGFFLHIPFPQPLELRKLKQHAKLIKALCHYDVVGFQTAADLHAFIDYLEEKEDAHFKKDVNFNQDNGAITAYGRTFNVGVYPVGIYPDEIAKIAAEHKDSEPVVALLTRFLGRQALGVRKSERSRQMIISAERLDYTKGIPERVAVIEQELQKDPNLLKKAVFVQIAPTTSRQGLPVYQQLKEHVATRVEDINQQYRQGDLKPIEYLDETYDHQTLLPLLRTSDIAWVTPMRDGMNLLAAEFVAAQDPDDPGVLILSKYAGVVEYLGDSADKRWRGALVVDPKNPEEMAQALHTARSIPLEEKKERYQNMMQRLKENDLSVWYNGFTGALKQSKRRKEEGLEEEAF